MGRKKKETDNKSNKGQRQRKEDTEQVGQI